MNIISIHINWEAFVLVLSLTTMQLMSSCSEKPFGKVTAVATDASTEDNRLSNGLHIFPEAPGLYFEIRFKNNSVEDRKVFFNTSRALDSNAHYYLIFYNKNYVKDSIELFAPGGRNRNDMTLPKGKKVEVVFVVDGPAASNKAKEDGILLKEEYEFIVKNIASINVHCKSGNCYKIAMDKSSLNLR